MLDLVERSLHLPKLAVSESHIDMALQATVDSKQVVVENAFDHGDDNVPKDSQNHVKAKYMGSTVDQQEMHALGRIQQLRVRCIHRGPVGVSLANSHSETFNTYQF